MIVNVNQAILNYENKPLQENGTDVLFRHVFSSALNGIDRDEKMSAEKKGRMYALTTKIYQTDNVDFTINEAALIQERVALFFPPLSVGRVQELFAEASSNKAPETTPPLPQA